MKGIMGEEGFKGISQYFELRFLENWTDDNTRKKGDVVNGQEQKIIIKIQGNKIALEYESTAGQSPGKGKSGERTRYRTHEMDRWEIQQRYYNRVRRKSAFNYHQ
ncbi:MAG: hypothetical protein J7L52_01935 [Thermotogae bacterium]|nr:hypothetical protein [Thermotogota bacterium]